MVVNKENMRLWVAGLRSGRFPQGRNRLKHRGRSGGFEYCCLGVACEIAKENGVEVVEYREPGLVFFDGCDINLPLSVRRWLGLPGYMSNPYVGPGLTAISANDSFPRMAFEEIGRCIIDYYELEESDEPTE